MDPGTLAGGGGLDGGGHGGGELGLSSSSSSLTSAWAGTGSRDGCDGSDARGGHGGGLAWPSSATSSLTSAWAGTGSRDGCDGSDAPPSSSLFSSLGRGGMGFVDKGSLRVGGALQDGCYAYNIKNTRKH